MLSRCRLAADNPVVAAEPVGRAREPVPGRRPLLNRASALWLAEVIGGCDGVQDLVAREHGSDPRYRTAEDQRQRLGKLLADGSIAGELVHARATP